MGTHIHFNDEKNKKFPEISLNSCFLEHFLGTQKQVRISRGKRAIGGLVIDFLLFLGKCDKLLMKLLGLANQG